MNRARPGHKQPFSRMHYVRTVLMRRAVLVALVLCSGSSAVSTASAVRAGGGTSTTSAAEAATRLATNPEALIAAPVFFHGKQIAVRGDVEPAGALMKLAGTAKPVFVF